MRRLSGWFQRMDNLARRLAPSNVADQPKPRPEAVGRFSCNSKFDVIRGGVVEGVMPPTANADHASLGHSLFALLFTGMVFDVGLDGSTGKLQPELTSDSAP